MLMMASSKQLAIGTILVNQHYSQHLLSPAVPFLWSMLAGCTYHATIKDHAKQSE